MALKTPEREVKVESNDYYDGLSSHYHMFQQNWSELVSKEREGFKYVVTHFARFSSAQLLQASRAALLIDLPGRTCAHNRAFFDGENVKKVLDASCGSGEQAIALAGLNLQARYSISLSRMRVRPF